MFRSVFVSSVPLPHPETFAAWVKRRLGDLQRSSDSIEELARSRCPAIPCSAQRPAAISSGDLQRSSDPLQRPASSDLLHAISSGTAIRSKSWTSCMDLYYLSVLTAQLSAMHGGTQSYTDRHVCQNWLMFHYKRIIIGTIYWGVLEYREVLASSCDDDDEDYMPDNGNDNYITYFLLESSCEPYHYF
jgi:hypothetical protein